MAQDIKSNLALDGKIEDLERRESELATSLAVISERLEHITERLDLNIVNFASSYDKLCSKMEALMDFQQESVKRIERIEEKLLEAQESKKAYKNTFWGVGIAVLSILLTKWIETWALFGAGR